MSVETSCSTQNPMRIPSGKAVRGGGVVLTLGVTAPRQKTPGARQKTAGARQKTPGAKSCGFSHGSQCLRDNGD